MLTTKKVERLIVTGFMDLFKKAFIYCFSLMLFSCFTHKLPGPGEEEYNDPQGFYYEVEKGDNLKKLAKKFNIHENAILDYNNLPDPSYLPIGKDIYIPSKEDFKGFSKVLAKKKLKKTKKSSSKQKKTVSMKKKVKKSFRSSKKQKTLKGKFTWPLKGVVTSKFGLRWGRRHDGIDIAAPKGTPIYSTADGEVLHIKWKHPGYGHLLIIKHGKNFVSIYAHNKNIFVKSGQKVKQGQKIASVGMTGRTTGPHLHFEIRLDNRPVNPLRFLK